MAFDNDENDVFNEGAEGGGNGEEQSNRTFRMAVIGLGAIGVIGVLAIVISLFAKQGGRNNIEAQNQAIQATNTAIAMLALITPTPLPTNTSEPTRAPAPTVTPRPTETSTPAPKDVVEIALANSNFKTLANALKAAGLTDVLKGPGPFTFFAPTDDAFAKLPAGSLDALLNNPQTLANVLKYHVITGTLKAADVGQLGSAKTLEGDSLKIVMKDGQPTINNADVTVPDISAANGMIQGIDTVLLPPGLDLAALVKASAAASAASTKAAATAVQGTLVAQNATLVPTRVPPQSATATAAASKTVTGTVGSKTTPVPGAVPTTGAGDYAWLFVAIGLGAIVLIARRMRTAQS